MNVKLTPFETLKPINASIVLSGSKSESNRLLVLQALMDGFTVENLSNADDVLVMQKALASKKSKIDVHHAGTAMRFLTAYFSVQTDKEVLLTGSDRMKERPIAPLVDALRTIGASIIYTEKEGFPPLLIKGSNISATDIKISGAMSSQFVTSLLLLAPHFKQGLQMELLGKITSKPYIEMTLELLQQLGFKYRFNTNLISISPFKKMTKTKFTVESDWSSASYHFGFLALAPIGSKIMLSYFYKNSLQGDSNLVTIYKKFGIQSSFLEDGMLELQKTENSSVSHLKLNLANTPDLAQTIVVTCLGLGISCELTGLHTLVIKETNRLEALQTELQKMGAIVQIDNQSIIMQPPKKLSSDAKIATYNDHRMAMAFAPLSVLIPLEIEDAEVVSKSYPNFWVDIKELNATSIV